MQLNCSLKTVCSGSLRSLMSLASLTLRPFRPAGVLLNEPPPGTKCHKPPRKLSNIMCYYIKNTSTPPLSGSSTHPKGWGPPLNSVFHIVNIMLNSPVIVAFSTWGWLFLRWLVPAFADVVFRTFRLWFRVSSLWGVVVSRVIE